MRGVKPFLSGEEEEVNWLSRISFLRTDHTKASSSKKCKLFQRFSSADISEAAFLVWIRRQVSLANIWPLILNLMAKGVRRRTFTIRTLIRLQQRSELQHWTTEAAHGQASKASVWHRKFLLKHQVNSKLNSRKECSLFGLRNQVIRDFLEISYITGMN